MMYNKDELSFDDKCNNLDEIKRSYMSKEEFIQILSNIEFLCIKEVTIELITGFKYIIDDKGDKTIKPLSKTININ